MILGPSATTITLRVKLCIVSMVQCHVTLSVNRKRNTMLVQKTKDLISLIDSVINNNFNIFLCKENRKLDMVASSKPKFPVVNCFLLYHCGEGLLIFYKRYWNIKKGVGTEILRYWIWIWVYVGMWDSLTRAFF